jgi:hypothetical protein
LNHLTTQEEIDFYTRLADRGDVIRSQVMKKGRTTLVFRLKKDRKEDGPVTPSLSPSSECSLTDGDSEAIAGCFEFQSRRQIERWIGWGLIPARFGG